MTMTKTDLNRCRVYSIKPNWMSEIPSEEGLME